MNRRFLVVPFVLSLMVGAWLMMPHSAKAQSSNNVATALSYEENKNDVDISTVYSTTADYIPVCFSPCNLFFSASQPVTWTIAVNGAPSISPPRKAVTATLTASDGIYRITASAAFRGGPTQQLEFTIQIIGDPVPVETETTCLSGAACVIALRLGTAWPQGANAIFKVKVQGALYDLYYYTPDRTIMLLQVIPGTLVRRIPVGITLTASKYTGASLTTTVNVVAVNMTLKLPLIRSAPAVGQ